MKLTKVLATACAVVAATSSMALAFPTGQINIPSTDAKALKEVTFNISNYARFSNKSDAGAGLLDLGVQTGLLPFEAVKLEIGADYFTTGVSSAGGTSYQDKHPFFFNAKLATAEDAGVKGLPAFAIGAYNLGTASEGTSSTRQNIVYALTAKTLPVIGRISVGGYKAAKLALANGTNTVDTNMNTGVMASIDRSIPEISDKLWMAVDYMSGNNGNGEISYGLSWAFSKQITLLAGVTVPNPFYKPSYGEAIPGGKPTLTTQLFINLP